MFESIQSFFFLKPVDRLMLIVEKKKMWLSTNLLTYPGFTLVLCSVHLEDGASFSFSLGGGRRLI